MVKESEMPKASICITKIWGVELSLPDDVYEGVVAHSIAHLRYAFKEIVRASNFERHQVYPAVRLDSGCCTQIELGLANEGMRVKIVIKNGDSEDWWVLRKSQSRAIEDCDWVDFMCPQHTSVPEFELLPIELVYLALEQWMITKSMDLTFC
jgi:hypothetical protein